MNSKGGLAVVPRKETAGPEDGETIESTEEEAVAGLRRKSIGIEEARGVAAFDSAEGTGVPLELPTKETGTVKLPGETESRPTELLGPLSGTSELAREPDKECR